MKWQQASSNSFFNFLDIQSATEALYRSAELARKTAIDTNTSIVVMENGKIVHIPAECLRNKQKKKEAN